MARVSSSIPAVLVALIALLVLLGWAVGSPTLKGVAPGLATMKANAAVAFLLQRPRYSSFPGTSGERGGSDTFAPAAHFSSD